MGHRSHGFWSHSTEIFCRTFSELRGAVFRWQGGSYLKICTEAATNFEGIFLGSPGENRKFTEKKSQIYAQNQSQLQ